MEVGMAARGFDTFFGTVNDTQSPEGFPQITHISQITSNVQTAKKLKNNGQLSSSLCNLRILWMIPALQRPLGPLRFQVD
jgi:hypothetical protein